MQEAFGGNHLFGVDLVEQVVVSPSGKRFVFALTPDRKALKGLLAAREPWVVPFVVLLVGEYVVEIIEDIATSLPTLDRAAYASFAQKNRPLMQLTRERVMSYYDCYYKSRYPDRRDYLGLIVLQHWDAWAACDSR